MRNERLGAVLIALCAAGCGGGNNNGGIDSGSADVVGADAAAFSCTGDDVVVPPIEGDAALDTPIGPLTGVPGDRAAVLFSFESGEFLSFLPWRPLMLGSQETVTVLRDHILPTLTVTSNNEAVLRPTAPTLVEGAQICCDPDPSADGGQVCGSPDDTPAHCGPCALGAFAWLGFSVQAVAEGDARLTLHTADGTAFETIVASVRAPARLSVERVPDTGASTAITSLTLGADPVRLKVFAFAADGTQLEARFGIDATSTTAGLIEMAGHSTTQMTFGDHASGYDVVVHGLHAGSGTLVFRAGSVTTELPVTVTQ